jgi:hypothetical protein
VVYESKGRARCLLEAAAARGFAHVPVEILDSILLDMAQPVGGKPRLSKVSRIIDFWKAQWGWSQVDVARALMHILPGAKAAAREPAIPESTGRDYIWSDLPSIAAALEAHKLGCQSAAPEPVAPPARGEVLLETLSFLEEKRPPQPRPRTADAKRASARFASQPHLHPHPIAEYHTFSLLTNSRQSSESKFVEHFSRPTRASRKPEGAAKPRRIVSNG